ncbi:MAG: chemotaxis protein CheW [Lachnospiraceae bacterium]
MAATQQIIFRVGDGEYGMNVTYVNAIEALSNVVSVPNAAAHILGIMNLRGEVLPVYSLRTKFGLEEVPADEQTKTIVTNSNGVSIAFKVDAVKEIIDCEPEMLSAFPDIARTEQTAYVDQVASKDGRLILLIDQNKLLAKEESEAISHFVSDMSNHQ